MQHFIKHSKAIAFAVLGVTIMSLLSFTPPPAGGEGFEIFLNNKLVIRQYGSQVNTVGNIELGAAATTGELTVKYYHCGRAGKERNITIKNDQDKFLKAFHYGDAASPNAMMLCHVKDLAGLQKFSKTNELKLYYSSTELPNGRLLAYIKQP